MRRRGYPAAALREFCSRTGVAKRDNTIEIELLEHCVRDELNRTALRAMAVLDPVKLVITNYPADTTELLDVDNNPEDPESGTRQIPFSGTVFIEREDFMEEPSKKFFRLAPGQMVRLKSAYIIQCDTFDKDPDTGLITAIYGTYFPQSRSGADTSGLKAKGTLHWVCATTAVAAEIRMYDRLFTDPDPTGHEDKDYLEFVNAGSLTIIDKALAEPGLRDAIPGQAYQFLRKGYFCADVDSRPEKPVFNLMVGLKESWKGGQ